MVLWEENLMPTIYIRCTVLDTHVGPLEKHVVTETGHSSHMRPKAVGIPRLNYLQHGLSDGW